MCGRPAITAYPGAVTTETDPARWIDVLAGSHDRICDLVGELDATALGLPSRCSDWSIAQVLSHLGSGAEIFTLMLDAVVAGEPTPGREVMPPIWERWNGLPPVEQAEAFLATDGRLIERLENLGDRLDNLTFTFFGVMQLDAVGALGMRLSEHAVHTWDVAAALDPAATVDPDAVALLVDRLPDVVERSGRAEAAPPGMGPVSVTTSDPERHYVLTLDGGVHLGEVEAAGEAHGETDGAPLRLPAECLLRLVYGRLDPGRTPHLDKSSAAIVDSLRGVFPGI